MSNLEASKERLRKVLDRLEALIESKLSILEIKNAKLEAEIKVLKNATIPQPLKASNTQADDEYAKPTLTVSKKRTTKEQPSLTAPLNGFLHDAEAEDHKNLSKQINISLSELKKIVG